MNDLLTTRIEAAKITALMAARNLLASRFKSLLIGMILSAGAFAVVVGSALFSEVDEAMERSVVGSVIGHIQVYSARSKSELTVIGSLDAERAELAPFADFAAVRAALRSVPNVRAVVPMGIVTASLVTGNAIDRVLSDLRDLYRRAPGTTATFATPAIAAKRSQVREMVSLLARDRETLSQLEDTQQHADDTQALKLATSDAFWTDADRDPLSMLEFLENRVAPQAMAVDPSYLQFVGTDPKAFAATFERMRVIEGRAFVPGQRGCMLSKYVYEEQLKLKTARRLDKMMEIVKSRSARLALDPELQALARANRQQLREISLQLRAESRERVRARLQEELGNSATELTTLLGDFFALSDANFERRYRFFYRELAPALELYRVKIGDKLLLQALSPKGYSRAVSVELTGIFTYEGLDKAPQAGALNLVDLVTFRQLYGLQSDTTEEEIAAIRRASGARDLSRSQVETELFGAGPAAGDGDEMNHRDDGSNAGPDRAHDATDLTATLGPGASGATASDGDRYNPRELESGPILNAAVVLHDARLLEATRQEIEAQGRRVDLPLRAISWQQASGLVGQLISMIRWLLISAAAVIFVVAWMISSNALMISSLERVREFGTLRAIGAPTEFLLAILLFESAITGVGFGLLGACTGSGLVALIGKTGIPAVNDALTFLFSGPRLHPQLRGSSIGLGMLVACAMSVLANLYPAALALRSSPREAMNDED